MVRLSDTSLQYTLVVPELLLYDNFADLHCGNHTSNGTYDPCVDLFIGLLANSEVPRTLVVVLVVCVVMYVAWLQPITSEPTS